MLDENLPSKCASVNTHEECQTNPSAFFLKRNNTPPKNLWTVFFCQHGNEPNPCYALRYPDPSSADSNNRYAVALYDPYVPDVVYGEVLIIPQWTQPTLSPDAIRQNGGVSPPPDPILPSQFVIRLYNPGQEIIVRYKAKSWNSPASWEFEMPQHTFRQPSTSTLDHTLTDPAQADITPKLKFSWRKDSKLSKDLVCLMSGKTSTLPEGKHKTKEPDITLSIFKSLKEMTLYEPNLYRVEMEDFKGLEVVLLLGAVTIRDVYFAHIREAFHVSHTPVKTNAQTPTASGAAGSNTQTSQQKPPNAPNATRPGVSPPRITIPQRETRPPQEVRPQRPAETEAEAARRRKQDEVKPQEDARQARKLREAQEKAERKRQAEIEKETRRLQKLYGKEEQQVRTQGQSQQKPNIPPRPNPSPRPNAPPRPVQPQFRYHHHTPSAPYLGPAAGPYLQIPGQDGRRHSSVQYLQPRPQSTGIPNGQPAHPGQLHQKKSSFFGLRRASGDETKLSKKRSSMF